MYRCKCYSHTAFQDHNTHTSICCAVRQSFWTCLHPRGLRMASCRQLSHDCVISCHLGWLGLGCCLCSAVSFQAQKFCNRVLRKTWTALVQNRIPGNLFRCPSATLRDITEIQILRLPQNAYKSTWEAKNSQGSENISFMGSGVDLFSAQAIKQSGINGSGFLR
jgi:hypothetical protein